MPGNILHIYCVEKPTSCWIIKVTIVEHAIEKLTEWLRKLIKKIPQDMFPLAQIGGCLGLKFPQHYLVQFF